MENKLHVSSKQGKNNEMQTLHTIVRSKGFVWIANHPNSAFHWSQAGAHLALNPLGMWWAATVKEHWPDAGDLSSVEVAKVMEEFDAHSRWGDRRQELVFIGIRMLRSEIEALFDACLLTDEEMKQFEDYMSDQPNAVEVRASEGSPSRLSLHSNS
jgi:G3E family GTPase